MVGIFNESRGFGETQEVLQTSPLPLGYGAIQNYTNKYTTFNFVILISIILRSPKTPLNKNPAVWWRKWQRGKFIDIIFPAVS
jgi:hypothetical protein